MISPLDREYTRPDSQTNIQLSNFQQQQPEDQLTQLDHLRLPLHSKLGESSEGQQAFNF